MKQFRVPAIEAIGQPVVEREMKRRGYENARRAIFSWVQRRKVPEGAKIMLLELASAVDVEIDLQDLEIEALASKDESKDAAA